MSRTADIGISDTFLFFPFSFLYKKHRKGKMHVKDVETSSELDFIGSKFFFS